MLLVFLPIIAAHSGKQKEQLLTQTWFLVPVLSRTINYLEIFFNHVQIFKHLIDLGIHFIGLANSSQTERPFQRNGAPIPTQTA